MKSPWFPIVVSFIVIFASAFFVKFDSLPKASSSPVLVPSITIVSIPTPTLVNKKSDDYYIKNYAKCGEIPNIVDYSPTRFPGNYSPRAWSPTCRFIVWSATIPYSFGRWSASKYEGLFLYDLKTQKTTRLYTPKSESDVVTFKNWSTDTVFTFHQSKDNQDYFYDVPSQSILLKYNHD